MAMFQSRNQYHALGNDFWSQFGNARCRDVLPLPDVISTGGAHMFAKSMTTALVGSALIATAAFAQTPSTSTATTTAPAATTTPAPADMSHQGQWRTSKVVGLKIYNNANESLGSINDLLFDKDGKIAAAVIGVGGFLGVGEHYVAVPFEKIKWVNEPVPSGASTASNSSGVTGRPASSTTTGSATPAPTMAKPNPWYPDHGVFDATKDQLKSMPEFKYST
jgi:sporulation protein YlmC with PRC-barrel domain